MQLTIKSNEVINTKINYNNYFFSHKLTEKLIYLIPYKKIIRKRALYVVVFN